MGLSMAGFLASILYLKKSVSLQKNNTLRRLFCVYSRRFMSSDLMKALRRIVPVLQIPVLLYLFLLSISLLQSSFKLFGGDFAKQLMDTTSDPFLALVIGMIVTSVVQSSSVTTSLVVGMVAGGAIGLRARFRWLWARIWVPQ
jgi:hypothetical protein